MCKRKMICFWAILGLIVLGAAAGMSGRGSSESTAHALIKVLPYADRDPMAIEPPLIDKDIQAGFRMSMATLMQEQGTLTKLLERDKVRQTNWFRSQEDARRAMKVLKGNLEVTPQKEGDFIKVSMTCGSAKEAAVIVNEMVNLFISSQYGKERERIAARLAVLQERRESIENDLRIAEAALDDIRKASGFTDLDEHNYPHPITVRLIRLEERKDELALEMKGVQAAIENFQKREQSAQSAREELIVLQSKYSELHTLLQEAAAKKKDLDMARIQYGRGFHIRDERRDRVDEIKKLIEKLRILHEDPGTAKVQLVEAAEPPLGAKTVK